MSSEGDIGIQSFKLKQYIDRMTKRDRKIEKEGKINKNEKNK